MKKHKNRFRKIFSLLAAAALVIAMCIPALAAEKATAANIDLDKEGYIEIRPRYNSTYLSDGTFAIYRVAGVGYDDGNLTYVITDEFAGSGVGDLLSREALTDDEDLLKDAVLVGTLADYAKENNLTPVGEDEVTEESRGWIRFRGVTAGLYLVVQTADSTGFETAEPFLVTYPTVNSDGEWDYYVDASTKMALVPAETPQPEDTEISVTKVWNDDDDAEGLRPESIRVMLLADGEETGLAVTLPVEEDEWSYTFTDLPACTDDGETIAYTVKEEEVSGYVSEVTGTASDGYVITNTPEDVIPAPEYTEVPVTKVWDDNDDEKEARPDYVEVMLKAGEEDTDLTAVLCEDNEWSYTFVGLEKYNEEGEEIEYTVEEIEVPEDYTASVAWVEDPDDEDSPEGYVITNTYGSGKAGGGTTSGSGGGTSSTKLPQTGQLNWPIPILAIGGIFLFILGWGLNRSVRREKSGR